MQCYHRHPEDTALRCERQATQRFAEPSVCLRCRIFPPGSGTP